MAVQYFDLVLWLPNEFAYYTWLQDESNLVQEIRKLMWELN